MAAVVAVVAVVVECSCSDIDLVEARSLVVVADVAVVGASCLAELLDKWKVAVVVRNKEMDGSKALGLGWNKALGKVVVELNSEMEAPELWSGLVRMVTEYMVKLEHCVDLEIRVGA